MAAHRSKQEPDVEVVGEFKHETEKALLLILDNKYEQWFPLSVINSREDAGTSVTIHVQHWFAVKEGLENS